MLSSRRQPSRLIICVLLSSVCILLLPGFRIFAQEKEAQVSVQNSVKDKKFIEKFKFLVNGFTVGTDTRVFPYVSLADWFEPYFGLKMGHRSFSTPADRILHHFKIESFSDYSWKLRYLANSISTKNTKFSFLFKAKLDRDPFFYGVGNSTAKSQRVEATYSSIFFGGEVRQNISDGIVLRVSPGFWKFKSGLLGGGDFEEAKDAQYLSTRIALSDRISVDYWKASLDNQWSAFAEIAFPVNTVAPTYVRFNLQTLTQLPLLKRTHLNIGTRFEYLISTDRSTVPYFALPEAGSRSGLRGFSKARFRNYALAVLNFELAFPISTYFDIFLLTDLIQTASNPTKLLGKQIHGNFGAGLRLRKVKHPVSIGIAASHENVKLFSTIAIGSPW